MANSTNALDVKSKTIQTVYQEYLQGDYGVNRRYQRKLVWTVEEKERLIDSVLHKYPLPQFLIAAADASSDFRFEIIDGMQRLNAIVAFIENEFSLDGKYFDLETLASTKKLRDEGKLVQKTPILNRSQSVDVANYEIAQSVYQTADKSNIEEVFRRINSSGQKLSLQDLRQAGSTSPISEVVRELASRIRGDQSSSDIVPLSGMKALSISSSNNEYGISPDEILWVQQGVLGRPSVRSSGDEQLILDIVADMIFSPLMATGTPVRDQLFQKEDSNPSEEILRELKDPSWLTGRKEIVIERFMQTLDRINRILDEMPQGVTFKKHIGTKGTNPVPRYFEATFAAIYRLLFVDGKDLSDPALALYLLADALPFKEMPSGGGEWPADKKEKTVAALQERLNHAFDEPFNVSNDTNRSNTMRSNDFKNLVTGFLIENSSRDMKQGFLSLSDKRGLDHRAFGRIMQTLTAISNSHPCNGGHVLVGVADSDSDASRIRELDGIEVVEYRSLKIVGVDREALLRKESLDKYWDLITKKIADNQQLPPDYARKIVSSSKITRYLDKSIFVLFAPPVKDPVCYGKKFYRRVGTETKEVDDKVQFGREFDMKLREG
jgi:hypothetical protein